MEYKELREQHELFYTAIESIKYKGQKELDTYVHALLDIEESINKIYNVYISDIVKNEGNIDLIKERIWDIREEFRHIDYHINDAKLTE